MANLFARKPLDKLMAEAAEVGEHSLKRSLGPVNLVALGIGAIIGAGLFVRTAAAIADRAGPSVVLAFIVAGIGCAFAGLCYAEFASMIPVAGSAYTYSYATMGEFVAWIIGWDLILEYAVAASTASMPYRLPRKKRAIRSATCRSEFSDRSFSAPFFMCCSRMCSAVLRRWGISAVPVVKPPSRSRSANTCTATNGFQSRLRSRFWLAFPASSV